MMLPQSENPFDRQGCDMARIRSIKPEFWTSEQVMEISPLARLAFIGIWTFADDAGVHPASHKTLKAEVFPGDYLTAEDVLNLVGEMIAQGLVLEFTEGGKRFWYVTGWQRHQRIEKPTYRYPSPNLSLQTTDSLDDSSANGSRTLDDSSPTERRGEDRSGEESKGLKPIAVSKADRPECPHQEIIDLYHEILPMGTQVRIWNDQRKGKLRARWREDAKRQNLEWWRKLFTYIADSKFLTGRTSTKDRAPFLITLDWIVTSEKLVKIIEGEYHREYTA